MSYAVRLSETVKRDLKTIADWYRRNAAEDAVGDEWYNGFITALEGLQDNPQICSLARENLRVAGELREQHYGSGRRTTHRAIFEIKGEEVHVHAIRHVAQRDLRAGDLGLE